jgi:hypothetical protein
LCPGTERNHVAPSRTIVNIGLAITKPVIASLESVREYHLANRCPVKVVHLVFANPGSLTLAKPPLRKRMYRDTTSGRKEASVELDRPA